MVSFTISHFPIGGAFQLHRYGSAAAPTPAGSVYIAGSPEERSVFLHDVIFDGEFAQLAEHLSWRAVGALVLEVPPTSGELEAARERFLQRTALRPEQLAPALGECVKSQVLMFNIYS